MAQKVLSRPQKPDYLVFMCKEKVTERMLTLANEAGVKVFTFNTDVPEEARAVFSLALNPEPADRWQGANQLADAVVSALDAVGRADNPVSRH
ncbi:hypothetical protein [Marinobacter sediminum]|uniref:hypothetical protein n=1 Tax=Marinobacter sediminum TaxID=256323 RepID=UPI00193AA9A3|nr:hypothetical protein [Marinobacter sediminum]